MERAVRLRHGVPVPRLPELGTATPCRTCPRPGWLLVDRGRRCCSSRCWATCGRTWCRSCPSMRQYAGNWASAVWAFAPGAEEKLNAVTRSAANTGRPVHGASATSRSGPRSPCSRRSPGGPCTARAAACSRVLLKHLPDIDTRTVREGEFVCNTLIGFNFGDGHLHNEDLISAVQRAGRLRAGRARRRLGRVAACRTARPAVQGDRRGPRRGRARHLEGRRRGRRAAVAAQRSDPDPRDLVRAPGTRLTVSRTAGTTSERGRRHEHRGRGGQRAQRARRRRSPSPRRASQVTVLEAADEIGGGTRTSEPHFPACCTTTARRPPDGRRLAVPSPNSGLERYGLRWRCAGDRLRRTRSTAAARGCCTARSSETAAGLGPDGSRWQRAVRPPVGDASTSSPTTSWARCCGCRAIR